MDKQKKKVYIFGAAKSIEIVCKALKRDKCVLKGFVDNNVERQGKLWKQTALVYPPDILMKEEYDCVIIGAKEWSGMIYQQCLEMGIERKKITSFWSETNFEDIIDYNVREIDRLKTKLKIYEDRLNNFPYEYEDTDKKVRVPTVRSMEELADIIASKKLSLCRFGDGEFELMRYKERAWFQKKDNLLKERLLEVFHSKKDDIIVAIANNFGSLDCYTQEAADAIRKYMGNETRKEIEEFIEWDRVYYDAYISRPYVLLKDRENAGKRFEKVKKFWNRRNVLIVEGKYSRMGVNNDLLSEALSIRRILCPEKDAFEKYDEILSMVKENVNKDDLVLITLGPTATVLAYDVALMGIQAVDIGQIDNEYEWFLMNAEKREQIPGKMVAEITWCRNPEKMEKEDYIQQIVGEVEK